MELKQILNIHGKILWREQAQDASATSITADSRAVEKGSIYVAIRGTAGDGHRFIADAIKKGAIGLVVEDIGTVPDFFKGVSVEVLDSRLALQVMSQKFYDHPGDQMTGIAVTGTNGKTSFTYILEHLLNSIDYPCGVIGTINHHYEKKVWPTSLTTPDPVTLQARLKDFLNLGARAFVIEASSHALKQNRLNQGFDICVFSNLTRDHMDYHPDEEDYFLSKAKLFGSEMLKNSGSGFAVINGDDPWGQRLSVLANNREVFLYGESESCDFRFTMKEESLDKTVFKLQFPNKLTTEVVLPLIGKHNVYNFVAAIASVYLLDLNYRRAISLFPNFSGIPGRLQLLKSKNNVSAFVDYAHTDDALRKVLSHLRKLQPPEKGRVLTVFGCGGDRDKTKRKFMGQVAYDMSDKVYVTSDNPRTEDPLKIIEDICVNFDINDPKVKVESDRAKAIALAVSEAKSGDIILVAGKGHEDYQIIGETKNYFSDYEQLETSFQSIGQ